VEQRPTDDLRESLPTSGSEPVPYARAALQLASALRAPQAAHADPGELLAALETLPDDVRSLSLSVTLERDVAVSAAGMGWTLLATIGGRHVADTTYEALRQWRLFLLEVKRETPREELVAFLGAGPDASERPSQLGAPHISTLRSSDVPDDALDLSWPVQLALGRLVVELADAPVLATATNSPLEAARLRLLGDILEELSDADLDATFRYVATKPYQDLTLTMLQSLGFERRLELARSLVVEWEQQDGRAESEDLKRLIGRVSRSLSPRSMITEVAALQERLYESGAVAIDQLPGAIQQMLARKSQSDSFLGRTEQFVTTLEACADAGRYREGILIGLRNYPELLRSRRFEDGDRFCDLLQRHRREPGGFPTRQQELERLLNELGGEDVTPRLVRGLMASRPRIRAGMARLVLCLGPAAPAIILKALIDSHDERIAGEAEDLLATVGTPEWLADQLHPVVFDPRVAAVLLSALGRLGGVEHARVIAPYVRHTAPPVRLAALRAAHAIGGIRAIPALVGAFHDKSPLVVQGAIRLLSQGGYRDPNFVRHLVGLACESTQPVDPLVRVAAVEALARTGGVGIGEPSVEEQLLSLVSGGEGWRRLAVWKRSEPTTPAVVRAAVYETLGRIGDASVLRRLREVGKEPDASAANALAAAIAELERRTLR